MPLIVDGGRVPSRWADRRRLSSVIPIDSSVRRPPGLNLALINNMPDPALEDTELQFFELLDTASGDVPLHIKLYSLTGVPRSDRGEQHLNSFYFPFDDLWENHFDGVIITGTEPRHANLQDEPYWGLLTEVFDWAERNTGSTVLSCLAAHASVLYCDGIKRHPLSDKKFGVFDAMKSSEHLLTSKTGDVVRFPHSRWNEVREDDLTAAGYQVLTKSAEAGVDLFLKRKKKSLFVHFQGHPEYGAQTLAKEYRRDVKRFLLREKENYPAMPCGYFDEAAAHLLNGFREDAFADRREKLMASFPESAIAELKNAWQVSAISIYRNWVSYIASRKIEISAVGTFARAVRSQSVTVDNEIA